MKNKIFTLAMALFFSAFAVNAQKVSIADKNAVGKAELQKVMMVEKSANEKPVEKADEPSKNAFIQRSHDVNAKGVLLTEDFSAGLPAGWANVDNGTAGQVWEFDNPGDKTINTTSNANGFAIVDSDNYGSGGAQDADLITPTLDFSTNTVIVVEFEHFFRSFSSSAGTFSYSVDDGATWNEVSSWSGTPTANAALFSQDMSAELAGQATVRLKWNYTGNWAYYWAIDDIFVYEPDPYMFALTVPAGISVKEGMSHDYVVTIANTGTSADNFTVADAGTGAWTYELFQADSATALAAPIAIAAGADSAFVIRVTLPATGLSGGDEDLAGFNVTSAEGTKAVESFTITTAAIAPYDVPYNEDFTTYLPENWSEFKGILADPTVVDGTTSAWSADGFANVGTTGAAKINIYGTSRKEWLVTPEIHLGADYVLAFDMALTAYSAPTLGTPGVDDKVAVVVSTDGGVTWNLSDALAVFDNTHTFSLNEHVLLPLGAYNNSTVMIGFYAESTVSNADNDFFIDNVSIFEPFANDVSVSQLAVPAGMLYQGNTYPVSVTVTNMGTALQAAGVPVSFKEEGIEFATAVTTIDLAWGESEVVTVDYTGAAWGTFAIEASVAADEDISNDMVTESVTILQIGMLLEDFEGDFLPDGWTESAVENNWTQSEEFDGMAAFLLHDVSSAEELLITPLLTLDGSITELSYWAFDGNGTFGFGSSQIQVKYSADGTSWTDIGDTATLGDAAQFTVDLTAIPNGDYHFAFSASSTFEYDGYNSLTAIDNVAGPVRAGLVANDLKVAGFDYTHELINEGDTESVFVEVTNMGTAAQTGVELTLAVNGVALPAHTLGTLGYGQSEIVEFSIVAVAGRHTFEASLPTDDFDANNTKSVQIVVTAPGMLAETFEADFPAANWTLDEAGIWFQWENPFVGAWDGINVAGTATSTAGTFDALLLTPKVVLTGTVGEELNFYAALGNAGVGEASLDIVYSADGLTFTPLMADVALTDVLQLVTVDLSGIAAGEYYLGFDATVTGDGTYSTLFAIDQVTGPELAVPHTVTFVATDGVDPMEGANININATDITTDATGTATIDLFSGTYAYVASVANYANVEGTVTVVDGVVTEDIVFTVPSFDVVFTVDNESGALLEGASVVFDGVTQMTDAMGVATFSVVDGTYNYTVTFSGYDEATGSITVAGANVPEAVEMIESIVDPINLAVVVDGTNATFTYDVVSGFFDDMESYDDFIIDGIGEYTMIDGDGATTYGFTGITFPNSGYVGSYIVYNPLASTPATDGMEAYSGDKLLACFASTAAPNNDWLILPQQTIVNGTSFSFMAKTFVPDYGLERFKVGVSTTGMAESDFTFISEGSFVEVPADAWTAFSYDLSAYAGQDVYIAIQCVSNDSFVFMLDDISLSTTKAKGFVDYAIYLDDMTTPYQENVQGTSIDFTGLTEGTHTAGVQRVYSNGTSQIVTIDFEIVVPTYTVTFNVSEARGPIEGASIAINGETLTTDAAGVATITLPDATYPFTVTATGFGDYTDEVNVNGADVPVNVALIGMGDVAANFSIYPNPTTGILNVQADGTNNIVILNAIGQVVYTKVLSGNGTIDLSNNASGVYFVRFQSGNNVATQRIILE